jgi:hypothetical protein
MKKNILYTLLFCSFLLAGCEYDNFDEPKATLSGKVVYGDKAMGVRATGLELELWQDGYDKRVSIPVYIAHDGSYSVKLFNGEYKLVRKAGAPWEAQLNDTVIVNVKGNTEQNVPVNPYFIINNERFQKGNNAINASFTIERIVAAAQVAEVRVYLSKYILTDQNKYEHAVNVDAGSITFGQEKSVSVSLPDNLVNESSLFVRVGVRSTVSNEFYYTQVQKVEMK